MLSASSICVSTMPGFSIQVGDQQQCLPVDQVIICADRNPSRSCRLVCRLLARQCIIRRCRRGAELDAKRAIGKGGWLPSLASRPFIQRTPNAVQTFLLIIHKLDLS